jgi:hypothetical protein
MTTEKLDSVLETPLVHVESERWHRLLVAVEIAVAAGVPLGVEDANELFEVLQGIRPLLEVVRQEVPAPAMPVEEWTEYVEEVAERYRTFYSVTCQDGRKLFSSGEIVLGNWDQLLWRGWFEDYDVLEGRDTWLPPSCDYDATFYWLLEGGMRFYAMERLQRVGFS